MRILILSQEPPFNARQLATGNALRTHQLNTSLLAAGHDLKQVWLDRDGNNGGFRSADELRGLIQSESPDVILVSYWELLELLPFDPPVPVILDFLAPRPLEVLFENPDQVGGMLRRLRVALARCDLLLVGNSEQEKLLSFWLLEAGFDLREENPVCVVGLAGEPVAGKAPSSAAPRPLQLVSGGVSWPWRQDVHYQAAIEQAIRELDPEGTQLALVKFGGAYRWQEPGSVLAANETSPDQRPLAPYRDWSAFLRSADIGLELGQDHIERRFSQSFRSLDFLRHGLPLLISAGQPMAEEVRNYAAGWVVDSPEDISAVLQNILQHPEHLARASANALQLVRERHDPAQAIVPLLRWLESPRRAARLPGYGVPDPAPPVLGKPPVRDRLARRYRLVRRIILNRWLTGEGKYTPGEAIVMLSREDLFPTDHGAAVKIVETARGLSRNGREVLLLTHSRSHYWRFQDGERTECSLPGWLKLLSRPLALVKLTHYTLDIPESNAFLYIPLSDGSFFWRLLWVATRHRAGIFQAEFPAYALPCQRAGEVLGIPTVLVQHNVEYARLKAQIPELTRAQFERFRAIEIDLCNHSQAVVCVSDNDRQRLAADGVHPGLLHTIPHGIDLQAFDEAPAADARATFAIPEQALLLVYHGTFAYPPNRDALQMLAEEVLPRLEQRGIEAHVLAVGHQPPSGIHPRIHCTGSVEQVPPWLKAADIAVVPLREGGGTRMKIIDDFAASLPVVATAKGIEGIPATDGVHALIRNDWDQFSDAIATLASDQVMAKDIAAQGRALAEALDWRSIGARYVKLMDNLTR